MKLVSAALLAATLLVPHSIMVKVMRVHVCEERGYGWHVDGPTYFGGLGWKAATWDRYRLPGFPSSAALATVEQQARAMVNFAAANGWPDQSGCQKGGY